MENLTKHINTDICILGGGPAGYVAAIRAGQLGAKVVLIEKENIGGTCLNWGCIPTKTLLQSAQSVKTIKKSTDMGIEITGISVLLEKAITRKNKIVKNLKTGLEYLLQNKNVTIIKGEGLIKSSNKIQVKTAQDDFLISCTKLIITTGSTPSLPKIKGIESKNVITSNEAVNLQKIPKSITILGAGAIGLEFATLFNELGSNITVIELKDKILPQEDIEISTELLKIMKRQGIKFKLKSKVKEIKQIDNELLAIIEESDGETEIISEQILIATGRQLNLNNDILNLNLKIKSKETGGGIQTNESMETSLKNVYAAGDITGGKLLAHLAFAEGKCAAENICGQKSTINYNTIPTCVYTYPEVASVGLNEAEALSKDYRLKIGRFEFRNNGRSLSLGNRDGFVKIIIDKQTDIILGAQILAPEASELISEITLAITLNAKAHDIADMIHPHPTLSEAIMEACQDAIGRAIHKN
jgi:dihydrolipoamide dehydrogenase